MKRIVLIALGMGAANLVSAGVYVEMVRHKLSTQESELSQKVYVQGGSGRFVDAAGGTTLIKDGTMYVIDDADKSYVVFDKANMEKLAQKLNAMAEQLKEQLSKLPPEQRPAIEAQVAKDMPGLLGGGGQYTVEAIDTGKSDKVEGHACRLWDIKRNGELDEQLCVVPYAAMPGKENFQAMFASFAKVFAEMEKSVPMMAGAVSSEFSAQAKVNGYPVRSRSYENGKLADEEDVLKLWREETFPASMFEVPAGYKRKDADDMGE